MAIEPQFINSANDDRLDPYRDVRDKDLRGRDDLFMAESVPVIRRLLRNGRRIHSLLLTEENYRSLADAIDLADSSFPLYVAPIELMIRISGFHIHRGALAAGFRPSAVALAPACVFTSADQEREATFVIAEGMTNVDNMGAMFRTSAAFGVDGILLDPRCCDPLYRKAVRVSMGHVLSTPYAVARQWPDDLAAMRKQSGIAVIGLEHHENARAIWDVALPARCGIVVGSEADGISDRTLSMCDHIVQIPMSPGVPSLNVAQALTVALYELRRQRDSGQ